MKRVGLVAAVLMLGAMCGAQMMSSHRPANGAEGSAGQNPHGSTPSSRTVFGRECGISDPSSQSAIALSRSPGGTWSLVTPERRPGAEDNAAARVWHESNWMVDVHEAPAAATTMHTGQMCFAASGQLTRMIDRYMDMPRCSCMRYTALDFDANGHTVKQEQTFVNANTGVPMAAPEAAKGFPEVFGFRKLDQLPFYSLVKK